MTTLGHEVSVQSNALLTPPDYSEIETPPSVSARWALPFVRKTETEECLWSVEETGDPSADNALGRSYAKALLAHMQQTGYPGLLGLVVQDMARKMTGNRFGPIEIGFFNVVAMSAL